jgi:hypothetical protein
MACHQIAGEQFCDVAPSTRVLMTNGLNSVIEVMARLGPLMLIELAVSVAWLTFLFLNPSKNRFKIDQAEVLAILTIFVGLAAIAVAVSGVRSMEQFTPLHFNLSLAFTSVASCIALFGFFKWHPQYEAKLNRIVRNKAAFGFLLSLAVHICIQLIVLNAFPVVFDYGSKSTLNLKALLVGDVHSTIGLACILGWFATFTSVAMVASLRRLVFLQK